eukprot:TRINITY_DN62960_c0_g1_i1.p1 TRINITY_DN62960_c0_g1~~TRINITY_DN62960_c0_g1_i1.p1  ORF type:complete len:282 (-),score=46.57 TRINITY_DN62960_c0_g1_i1:43-888(-)
MTPTAAAADVAVGAEEISSDDSVRRDLWEYEHFVAKTRSGGDGGGGCSGASTASIGMSPVPSAPSTPLLTPLRTSMPTPPSPPHVAEAWRDGSEDRQLRRLHHNAEARRKAGVISSMKRAERESIKERLVAEENDRRRAFRSAGDVRADRWARKTADSPFRSDWRLEDDATFRSHRARDAAEKQRSRTAELRERKIRATLLARSLSETDWREELRREKRTQLESEKKLRALRDVERTNVRAASVLLRKLQRGSELQRPEHAWPSWPSQEDARTCAAMRRTA